MSNYSNNKSYINKSNNYSNKSIIIVIIFVIRLYNCNMSNKSNCNSNLSKKLTEFGSLLHRMHDVK